jgi:hypothetical protein
MKILHNCINSNSINFWLKNLKGSKTIEPLCANPMFAYLCEDMFYELRQARLMVGLGDICPDSHKEKSGEDDGKGNKGNSGKGAKKGRGKGGAQVNLDEEPNLDEDSDTDEEDEENDKDNKNNNEDDDEDSNEGAGVTTDGSVPLQVLKKAKVFLDTLKTRTGVLIGRAMLRYREQFGDNVRFSTEEMRRRFETEIREKELSKAGGNQAKGNGAPGKEIPTLAVNSYFSGRGSICCVGGGLSKLQRTVLQQIASGNRDPNQLLVKAEGGIVNQLLVKAEGGIVNVKSQPTTSQSRGWYCKRQKSTNY